MLIENKKILLFLLITQSINIFSFDINEELSNNVERNRIEQVRFLISKGADVNYKDIWGWTPLMKAVVNNHIEIIKELVALGADINAVDNKLESVLILASKFAKEDTLKLLISLGADTKSINKIGKNKL